MKLLIRFEDTYGMTDIFKATHNLTQDINSNALTRITDNLYLTAGMGIHNCMQLDKDYIDSLEKEGITKILFVFDVDNPSGDKFKVLSKEDILQQLTITQKYLNNLHYQVEFVFMPVVYSAETIMLYQFISDSNPETDVESLVHNRNTNKFQLSLLARLLGVDKLNKAKKVRNYLDISKLKSKIRKNLEYRNTINKRLLEWILKDCNLNTKFYSEEELFEFVENAQKLLDFYLTKPTEFKIGDKNCTSWISSKKLLKV